MAPVNGDHVDDGDDDDDDFNGDDNIDDDVDLCRPSLLGRTVWDADPDEHYDDDHNDDYDRFVSRALTL